MNKEKTSKKRLMFLIFSIPALTLGCFVAWKNIQNRIVDGCCFVNENERDNQGNEYMITSKNVCYHERCYEGDLFCELHKVIIGFEKVEKANPKMFITIPQYTFGVDEKNIYNKGKKISNSVSCGTVCGDILFSEYVLNFCDLKVESDFSRELYHGDREKLQNLCAVVLNKQAEWQNVAN